MRRPSKVARLHLSVVISIWSFGFNDLNTFSIENRIPLRPVLGGVRDFTFFIISHEQTQIKPSLQFSFLYFGLVVLEGSTFYQNFGLRLKYYFRTCVNDTAFEAFFFLFQYCYTDTSGIGDQTRFTLGCRSKQVTLTLFYV